MFLGTPYTVRPRQRPVWKKRKSTLLGIGGFELFIILLFGFLVFGPDKLPEIARTVGAAINKFKKAQDEMEAVIKGEVLNIDGSAPAKSATSSAPAAKESVSQESFAERKARYDKERAERIEANRREMRSNAAATARENEAAQAAQAQAASESAAAESSSAPAEPSLSPDELFGTKPIKPAPRAAQSQKGGE